MTSDTDSILNGPGLYHTYTWALAQQRVPAQQASGFRPNTQARLRRNKQNWAPVHSKLRLRPHKRNRLRSYNEQIGPRPDESIRPDMAKAHDARMAQSGQPKDVHERHFRSTLTDRPLVRKTIHVRNNRLSCPKRVPPRRL